MASLDLQSQSLLQSVDLPELQAADISLRILRLDKFSDTEHASTASGNKYFKLKHNFAAAKNLGVNTLLSFGGVWSNHLHALASEAAAQNMQSIGIVRGDGASIDTAMLQDVKALGMQIHFVSREDYRRRHDAEYLQFLAERFNHPYIIPEGGSNLLGAQGCKEIVALIDSQSIYSKNTDDYDVIALPVGSGGTLAGIASALSADREVLGYSVVQDTELPQRIGNLLQQLQVVNQNNWCLRDACYTGRYGQCNAELARFIVDFSARTGVPIEPTYSGKLFYALFNDIAAGYFPRGSRLIAVHTGGMQGWRGHQARVLQLAA
jgi:1-aminocyclopropane-1-carboxylate deaminase